MKNYWILTTALVAATTLLCSCDPTPDRDADCVIFECGHSWGHVGYSVWACGEGNEDQLLLSDTVYAESPFPPAPSVTEYSCGTDIGAQLGSDLENASAQGAGCVGLGIPEDRIGDETEVCYPGDDDSAP